MVAYGESARVAPGAGLGKSAITTDDHRLFVEEILLPCASYLGISEYHPEPLGFESASRSGVGHSCLRLTRSQIHELVDLMVATITEKPDLEVFAGFFFVIYNHGLKKRISVLDVLDTTRLGLEGTCLDINSELFSPRQLYLDFAVTFLPPEFILEPCTGLWGDWDFTIRLLALVGSNGAFLGKSSKREDQFANISGLGGFKFTQDVNPICSFQAYGVWKHAFFQRNHQSGYHGFFLSAQQLYERTTYRDVANWKVLCILIVFVLV